MSAPDAPVVEARDIAVRYPGHTALEVERLEVRPAETLAIIGPNGSGKSTLLHVLALLRRPDRGSVRFHGREVSYRPAALLSLRRRMAAVFQAPLLVDATVYDNVALGLRFRRLPERELARRVGPWLERLGIAHLAGRRPRTLSGGEAQRTSLARAFVLEPEVLFLDEPFAALDPPTREGLLLELEAILREAHVTTVFVTHDRNEAVTLAGRVAVVIGGRLRQSDLPERVFARPASVEVARFVGVENLLPGVVRSAAAGEAVVEVDGGTIRVAGRAAAGERLVVALRAEDVALARPTAPRLDESANAVLGRVTRVVPVGGQLRVELDAGYPLRALVPKSRAEALRLAAGTELRALFPPSAPHLIAGTPEPAG